MLRRSIIQKGVFFIIMLTFLLSCNPSLNSFNKEYTIEKIYRNEIVISGKKVPLPKGNWKIASKYYEPLDNIRGFFHLLLIHEIEGTVEGMVQITTNSSNSGRYVYLENQVCNNTPYTYYNNVENNKYNGNHDCWSLRLIAGRLERLDGVFNNFFAYIQKKKLSLPIRFISSYHHFTKEREFLTVSYHSSPISSGFNPSYEWHPLQINGRPEKEKIINRRIATSKEWHEKVKEGFKAN